MSRVVVPFFISHQGCPHTCVFCDQAIISGSGGGLPTGSEITARIRTWRDSARGRPLEVAFFGGTFTALPREEQKRLLAPVQPLLASGGVTGVRVSTRPDAIDGDSVRWLAGQGVTTVELGVQSMDDGVLALAGRGHDAAASAMAIRCVRDAGLAAGAQLMPGLPGDSRSSALRSLHEVTAAGAHFVRIYPVVVLRGTELARRYAAGEYRPPSLDEGVAIGKLMLHAALKAGVDVIRIGLQAGEGLNMDSVLAGCLHPALGQLVRSELYYDLLQLMTGAFRDSGPLTVRCHPSRLSDVMGHGRKNIIRLRGQGIGMERVVPDAALPPLHIMVCGPETRASGSIVHDLAYDCCAD